MRSQDRDVKPRTWTQWEPNQRENKGRPGPECSVCGLGRGNGTGTLRDFGFPSSLGPHHCPSRPGRSIGICMSNKHSSESDVPCPGQRSENHGSKVTETWCLGPWEKGNWAKERTAWDPEPRCPFCAHKSQRASTQHLVPPGAQSSVSAAGSPPQLVLGR